MNKTKRWFYAIGPGLITACVVIGPGSILTSSQVGATDGYSKLWVVLIAAFFMAVYMTLGAKLGVISGSSPTELVAARAGRPLAVLIGVSVFFIAASFQFGNNLGVHTSFETIVFGNVSADDQGSTDANPMPSSDTAVRIAVDYGVVIAFNVLSILFLFSFKDFYRALERLMMSFVAIMLICFAVNLFVSRPSIGALLTGFIPQVSDFQAEQSLALLGLVGTTFVIAAAYYQAYLVRQKGWDRSGLGTGLRDARVGSTIMFLITMMLVATAAAQLRGQVLQSPADVADGLSPLLKNWGKPVFCIGLFSAAYSSFLVNSMIGGFILADGLGLGNRPEQLIPRCLTAVVLLTGMVVALATIRGEWNAVGAIVAAQAVTVLAAPLLAAVLLWLTNREDVMGDDRNGPLMNVLASLGLLLLVGVAYYTASHKVWPRISPFLDF